MSPGGFFSGAIAVSWAEAGPMHIGAIVAVASASVRHVERRAVLGRAFIVLSTLLSLDCHRSGSFGDRNDGISISIVGLCAEFGAPRQRCPLNRLSED